MCTIKKVSTRKKSGNLFNDPRICPFQLPNCFYGIRQAFFDETPITIFYLLDLGPSSGVCILQT